MHWNTYFDAMIYLKSREKYPLQLVLREVLVLNQYNDNMMEMVNSESSNEYLMIAESMKYGIIIVASLPVLALYPFLQKHFMKGVMIGAIKG
jgi:putative aldouronate transport system permease protein